MFSLLDFTLATAGRKRVHVCTLWQPNRAYPALLKAILGTEKAFFADFKTSWALQASCIVFTVHPDALSCRGCSHYCSCPVAGTQRVLLREVPEIDNGDTTPFRDRRAGERKWK